MPTLILPLKLLTAIIELIMSKKLKLIIIIVSSVVLLIGVGLTIYFISSSDDDFTNKIEQQTVNCKRINYETHTESLDSIKGAIDCYDKDGNLVKSSSINYYGTSGISYYSDGNLIKVEHYTADEDNKLSGYSLYEYDEEDNLTKKERYDADGNLIETERYDDGNKVKTEWYDAESGNLERYWLFEYDDEGNWIKTERYDAEGNQIKTENYDEQYEVVKEQLLKDTNRLLMQRDGYKMILVDFECAEGQCSLQGELENLNVQGASFQDGCGWQIPPFKIIAIADKNEINFIEPTPKNLICTQAEVGFLIGEITTDVATYHLPQGTSKILYPLGDKIHTYNL